MDQKLISKAEKIKFIKKNVYFKTIGNLKVP